VKDRKDFIPPSINPTMGFLRGQGAIESKSASIAGTLLAQGATEYLVLLAVVLIVALVSVALLGFFPGMASDAQRQQSQMYWSSAQPISVVEWGFKNYGASNPGYVDFYMRLRNSGMYKITITKFILDNGLEVTGLWCSTGACPGGATVRNNFALAPGEEKMVGQYPDFSEIRTWWMSRIGSGYGGYESAQAICNLNAPYGYFIMNKFGFEYEETIDGQVITKRQIGKPVVVQCRNP